MRTPEEIRAERDDLAAHEERQRREARERRHALAERIVDAVLGGPAVDRFIESGRAAAVRDVKRLLPGGEG